MDSSTIECKSDREDLSIRGICQCEGFCQYSGFFSQCWTTLTKIIDFFSGKTTFFYFKISCSLGNRQILREIILSI